MESSRPKLLFLCFIFLASAASTTAHIAEYDEYWEKKAALARAASQAAYNPNPESVANTFNADVHREMDKAEVEHAIMNSTRRGLRGRKKKGGPCVATNPIDRCWRCRGDWNKNRKRLAKCARGFGRHTTGGLAGRFYVVTDPRDDDMVNPRKGTLRWGVIQNRPLWIIFAKDMIIRLSEELIVNSNKTIDGRGVNVRIANGAGITIQYVHNVILHSLHIQDITQGNGGLIRDSETHYGLRTRSDGDGISIFGSTNIWVDHVSMSNCGDGLIDAIMGSTAITISNSHFTQHNDVMLFGASDAYSPDALMQITVAFNHFGRGLVQRMPRCRWGFVHVVNNDYTHWLMYAIGGSKHPTILSQGNRFFAPPNIHAKEVTKREYSPDNVWKDWSWRSEGDLMRNGAFFVPSGRDPDKSTFDQKDLIKAKPGTFVARLTRYSGSLDCVRGQPC
ncbi:pectate lyase-like [Zingiber officinale]|uniref:pectate lyase-like n=1 Tax=Zingiber officinale TaxID=94328 RepID=UPI001C4CB7A3|nr:pectate lyase-like [Zingiber officinale]